MTIVMEGRWDANRKVHLDLNGVRQLDFDMRQTTYLDSAAFTDIVRMIRMMWSWNGKVRLIGPHGPVLQMIQDSMLDRAVEVVSAP